MRKVTTDATIAKVNFFYAITGETKEETSVDVSNTILSTFSNLREYYLVSIIYIWNYIDYTPDMIGR